MAELALYVDSLPKKGNLSQQSQHRNSCSWYNWSLQDENHFCSNSRLDVQVASQGYAQGVKPPTFIRRLERLDNRKRATTAEPKRVVPRGEAIAKDIFTFSQHDNRHRIKAPEKKTVLSQHDRQSQSKNINNTMAWSANIKDGEYRITKTSHDRRDYKPDMNDDPVTVNAVSFRRFPKKHHQQTTPVRRSQSNILSHKEGQKAVRISLPILAQPQSYIGFQATKNNNNTKRAKTTPGGWCYSYHGKTFSKRVSNATQHACYRF